MHKNGVMGNKRESDGLEKDASLLPAVHDYADRVA